MNATALNMKPTIPPINIPNGSIGFICIPKSLKAARKLYWFDNTACYKECVSSFNSGNADGAAVVAWMHFSGAAGPKDRIMLAKYWASKAANLQNSYGKFVLALAYIESHDLDAAVTELKDSASALFGPAAWLLGALYEIGYGVRLDYREAERYYRVAADRKYVLAMSSLVGLYSTGKFGVLRKLDSFLMAPVGAIVLFLKQIFASKLSERYLVSEKVLTILAEKRPRATSS